MKKEALRHPKMLDLASRLGIGLDAAIGKMTLLWDFAQDYATRGDIGKLPDGAIAMACVWSGDPKVFVDALVDAGWLDRNDEHRLVIHDWPDHCERWVCAKLAKIGQDFLPCYRKSSTPERSTEATVEATVEASPIAKPNRTEPNPKPNRTEPNHSAGACAGLGRGDLRDTSLVLDWAFRPKRSKRKPLEETQANRLRVVAAAERALEHGDDPGALFASIVSKQQWQLLSTPQEDRARQRLREHDARGPPGLGADLLGEFARAITIGD